MNKSTIKRQALLVRMVHEYITVEYLSPEDESWIDEEDRILEHAEQYNGGKMLFQDQSEIYPSDTNHSPWTIVKAADR